jgi:exo-poly-alpha-galacturonosidase
VSIFGSSFDDGDDCINLNAGSNAPGVAQNLPDGSPSGPIHIFDNTTNHGHGGVVFGRFTAAWIQNVTAEDNYHNGTDIGLRFKTGTTRGGGAQNVTLRDTTVSNIPKDVIMMEGSYNDSTGMPGASQGYFTNITINNVTGTGKKGSYAIAISGNASPMHSSFTFSNINLTGADKGISIFQTKSSSFTNVTSDKGSFYYDKTATGLTFSGCSPAPTAK